MSIEEFQTELSDLVSAEDFLDYFAIEYDINVVQVNRLHILQRFHDYLHNSTIPSDEIACRQHYKSLLNQAYQDFVISDAVTEKVFRVFKMQQPQEVVIPLNSIKFTQT